MNEKYRDALNAADKIWAYFVGASHGNTDADELLIDAEKVRRFVEDDMFLMNTSSSQVIKKEGQA